MPDLEPPTATAVVVGVTGQLHGGGEEKRKKKNRAEKAAPERTSTGSASTVVALQSKTELTCSPPTLQLSLLPVLPLFFTFLVPRFLIFPSPRKKSCVLGCVCKIKEQKGEVEKVEAWMLT